MFVRTECAAELSVFIIVPGCGCPIYMSAIIYGTTSQEFAYIAPISDSAADVITTLIIWEMFNTALLFLWVSSLSDKKKYPPTGFLALG